MGGWGCVWGELLWKTDQIWEETELRRFRRQLITLWTWLGFLPKESHLADSWAFMEGTRERYKGRFHTLWLKGSGDSFGLSREFKHLKLHCKALSYLKAIKTLQVTLQGHELHKAVKHTLHRVMFYYQLCLDMSAGLWQAYLVGFLGKPLFRILNSISGAGTG